MSRRAFAAHLGVRAPDRPLLHHIAGPVAVDRQISVLAAHGFAGVSDNYLLLRDAATQALIGDAVREHGLRMGSFVHDPLRWNAPGWIDGSALDSIAATAAAAARTGSRTVTCITGRVDGENAAPQRRSMAETLRRAGDLLEDSGVVLCVEATHPAFAPGLLIEQVEEAIEVVTLAAHRQVRLCLDLGHVALHGRDPVAAIGMAAGLIGNVQIADVPADGPGRVEPGAGRLDWAAIFAALDAAGYDGLLELELEAAEPGKAGERAMLSRLAGLGLENRG
ncbi:MAG: sugar phosphate isomerase/epimerase family protein [Pseudomonadota bacterium]